MLDEIIENSVVQAVTEKKCDSKESSPKRTLIGSCMESVHPFLKGRILVELEVDDKAVKKWMPTLHGLTFRPNDRVLVQWAENFDEPIVTGVVDGFSKRPEIERTALVSIKLENDESIKIGNCDGLPLLEIAQSSEGPIVKLFDEKVKIDLPNELCIDAKRIELNAKQGELKLSATDNVVVKGEQIDLN